MKNTFLLLNLEEHQHFNPHPTEKLNESQAPNSIALLHTRFNPHPAIRLDESKPTSWVQIASTVSIHIQQ